VPPGLFNPCTAATQLAKCDLYYNDPTRNFSPLRCTPSSSIHAASTTTRCFRRYIVCRLYLTCTSSFVITRCFYYAIRTYTSSLPMHVAYCCYPVHITLARLIMSLKCTFQGRWASPLY
jgi:hypothetical protein